MSTPTRPHVVVVGAGVIGLTNAVWLAESGYTVTVIAAHVPGDESAEYTSPWAGAHWRTHASPDQKKMCDWDVQTHQYWLGEVEEEEEEERERRGLKLVDSLHYWDGPITEDLWWSPYVPEFRQLNPLDDPIRSINANRPPHAPGIQWGAASKAFSINVPRYLLYLQSRAEAAGTIIFKSRLPTDGGLSKALATAEGISRAIGRGKVACFVNATGLGARQLCDDAALFPIRGQTVLVKGEAKATRTRYHGGKIGEGESSYCIVRPGSGTTILGGTKEKGVWEAEPEEEAVRGILERCGWMVPELLTGADGGFEVIRAQAGLRPGREGGPRVEREKVDGREVVHSYGHAGFGYQASVGCARDVVGLVNESLGKAKDAISARL